MILFIIENLIGREIDFSARQRWALISCSFELHTGHIYCLCHSSTRSPQVCPHGEYRANLTARRSDIECFLTEDDLEPKDKKRRQG